MKIWSQLEVSRRQLLQMGLVTTAATLVSIAVSPLPASIALGQTQQFAADFYDMIARTVRPEA